MYYKINDHFNSCKDWDRLHFSKSFSKENQSKNVYRIPSYNGTAQ